MTVLTLKKNLGQYFTGKKLASLLVTIADQEDIQTVIDPMCGSGDMLAAVIDLKEKQQPQLFGIEIDPLVFEECKERLERTEAKRIHLKQGNAFDPILIAGLSSKEFDLVVTNPPYVRYQNLSRNPNYFLNFPSSSEIRYGLLKIVRYCTALSEREKEEFEILIKSYSGLSDLAVPSWILCAMFTRLNGTLAMVIPHTWLSRDYAQVIRFILLKYFRIRFIIEDLNAAWFQNEALVRTSLLVAQRIQSNNFLENEALSEKYLHVSISHAAINGRSIVGNMFPNEYNPETIFAKYLKKLKEESEMGNSKFASFEFVSLAKEAENLTHLLRKETWFEEIEKDKVNFQYSVGEPHSEPLVPRQLREFISDGEEKKLTTLDSLGIMVGQGLRTGANSFFYGDAVEIGSNFSLVKPNEIFKIEKVRVPNDCLFPVLRKQSELSDVFTLDSSNLSGRVLYFNNLILPEDKKYIETLLSTSRMTTILSFKVMDDSLASFVRKAAVTKVVVNGEKKEIPNLSAVRTNVRKFNRRKLIFPRFWYMLPPFAKRHCPDMFIPRINHDLPKIYLNSDPAVIIDANFSSIWSKSTSFLNKFMLLALFNSTWCVAAMEFSGTTMGGGALKLEAIHIKRLPIPILSLEVWKRLGQLGERLAVVTEKKDVLLNIDKIIMTTLNEHYQSKQRKLQELIKNKLLNRNVK